MQVEGTLLPRIYNMLSYKRAKLYFIAGDSSQIIPP